MANTLYGVVNDFLGYTEPKMNVLHFRLHVADTYEQRLLTNEKLRPFVWHKAPLSGQMQVMFDQRPEQKVIYERELHLSEASSDGTLLCLKEGSRFMVFSRDVFWLGLATFLGVGFE